MSYFHKHTHMLNDLATYGNYKKRGVNISQGPFYSVTPELPECHNVGFVITNRPEPQGLSVVIKGGVQILHRGQTILLHLGYLSTVMFYNHK